MDGEERYEQLNDVIFKICELVNAKQLQSMALLFPSYKPNSELSLEVLKDRTSKA